MPSALPPAAAATPPSMLKLALYALALLVGLGVVLLVGALIGNRVPLLAPPGPIARLEIYFGTNVAETAPDARLPELRTREYPLAPDVLLTRVAAACRALGWDVVADDPKAHTLHAVVTTRLLHFQDDVEVRVEPAGGKASRLHVRSSSRVGRGDLGANLHHVLELERAIDRAGRSGS